MSIIFESPSAQHDFSRGPHWYHESPFLPLGGNEEKKAGASSLKDTATRCLFMDQSAVKPELFENIPWMIARELWEYLSRRDKNTLYMWKIFTARYPQDFPRLSPFYSLKTDFPKSPLKGYLDIMKCDACHWRAVLSLSTVHATVTDLVDISNQKNLVALEINRNMRAPKISSDMGIENGAELEDGIVRSWLEVAQATGTLQNLQVLRIHEQHNLTHQVFWMLEQLPRLKLVVVYCCRKFTQEFGQPTARTKHGVQVAGWNAQRLDWISDGPQKGDALKRLGSLLDVYKDVLTSEDIDSKSTPPILGSAIPIMEFDLSGLDCDDTGTMERRARYAAESIFFFTRAPQRNATKRAQPEEHQPRSGSKRILKERGRRDMGDVLGDLLGM
ncbi:uncharacterized protein N7482_008472 [Penicillium canariense]|uniref:Uncharacterized protein n=1 Tax=Penicillium canariense TaxID=189055 RepID=A0A9W9HVV8_9EURO|nr:uncharacterized protein N7482_008472 [Penicillium canariense]KAJ5157372.1 hypothetical protein N7482_008472 [Penicillium canariense]